MKRTEKKIPSHRVLSILEQKLPVGRIEVSLADNSWFVSNGFRRLLGLEGGVDREFPNTVAAAIHADDRADFVQAFELMHSGQTPPARTFRLINANALSSHIRFQFETVFDPDQKPESFICIAHDISPEVLMSQAERNAVLRTGLLMEALNIDCFWRASSQGALFDYSVRGHMQRDDAIALGHGWLDIIHPDEREKLLSVWEKATIEGRAYVLHAHVIGNDGDSRPYRFCGFPRHDDKGRIIEWYGVAYEQMAADPAAGDGDVEIAEAASLATGGSIRALCALLDWTHEVAASRSGLSVTTINRFVTSAGLLVGQFRRKSVESMFQAFFAAGARFHITNDRQLFFSLDIEKEMPFALALKT